MKIFICGDSTADTYDPAQTQMVGWGQVLGEFLPNVTICNHAKAGRSTRTFLEEGRLQQLDGEIRPGDLVLIQFAHNDENKEKPERYADPWGSFSENLAFFVRFARERGGVPVLLTPICMRVWQDGALCETHGEYPEAMRAVAQKLGVPLIDIYRESFRAVEEAEEVPGAAPVNCGHYLMHNLAMAKWYAKEFADYLAANEGNRAIFEYPQTERLVTDDGSQFYDS